MSIEIYVERLISSSHPGLGTRTDTGSSLVKRRCRLASGGPGASPMTLNPSASARPTTHLRPSKMRAPIVRSVRSPHDSRLATTAPPEAVAIPVPRRAVSLADRPWPGHARLELQFIDPVHRQMYCVQGAVGSPPLSLARRRSGPPRCFQVCLQAS